ncbi:MAG: hypothetical protein R3C49_20365 [Planctomycetaceae bacterium]
MSSVHDAATGRPAVTFSWTDDGDVSVDTSYEIWVDQVVSANVRNSRVLYADDVRAQSERVDLVASQELGPGRYVAWVRRHDAMTVDSWMRLAFELDDGDNPDTPLAAIAVPERPGISVIREGQGASGQTSTESRIGWRGDESLYDVWLNKRTEAGTIVPHSLLRNVPARSISFRQLAAAAHGRQFSYFGQIDQTELDQLETGEYRIFV